MEMMSAHASMLSTCSARQPSYFTTGSGLMCSQLAVLLSSFSAQVPATMPQQGFRKGQAFLARHGQLRAPDMFVASHARFPERLC